MKNDLEQADKIMKLASETFLGLQSLYGFIGDADYVDTRITLKLTIHTHTKSSCTIICICYVC
jgi:hypothetical protein